MGDSALVIGRFAPSPTGALHAGSLVAALASYLHARAQGGQWLVRMEDVDTPRCVQGADALILQQLAACGLHSDGQVIYQSERHAQYQAALDQLVAQGLAYPCGCTRKDIEATQNTLRHHAAVYPGTCRAGLEGKPARAWRLNVQAVIDRYLLATPFTWHDERLGAQTQDVAREVGDFVLFRADGLWGYQLAVVVDDAAQGITQVVRGADLVDNTARQMLLQLALQLPTPRYLHTPLVLAANGEKLSKQNGAQALDLSNPQAALNAAAEVLGLPAQEDDALNAWTHATREAYYNSGFA